MARHHTQALPSNGAWHQFRLRGLLSFMLACSLYLSLIVALRDLLRWGDPWSRGRFPVVAAVLIPVVWFAFWWLYRRWGLRYAVVVHASGPIFFGGLTLLFGSLAALVMMSHAPAYGVRPRPDLDDVPGAAGVLLLSLYYGCTVSTLVSFPASIVMLLHLATKSRPVRTYPSPSN